MVTAKKTAGKTARFVPATFASVADMVGTIMVVASSSYDAAIKVRATLRVADDQPIPSWGKLSEYLETNPVTGFSFEDIRMGLIREWDRKYLCDHPQPRDLDKARAEKARLALIGTPSAEQYFLSDAAARGRMVEGREDAVKAAKALRESVIPGWCSDKWNPIAKAEGRSAARAAQPPKTVVDKLRGTKVEMLPKAVARAIIDGHGDTIPKEIMQVVKLLREIGWVAKVTK